MTRESKAKRPNPNYMVDEKTGDGRVVTRERLLMREPVSKARIEAFDEIHEQLANATELYLHHGDGGKIGAYRAVMDTIEYFASRGIPYAALEPLHGVALSLLEAERGVVTPLFKQKPRSRGAKPKPLEQLSFEGLLAIVLECCIRHHKAEGYWPYSEPAARMASGLILESRLNVDIGWKQLERIRERISTVGVESFDRVTYEAAIGSNFAIHSPLIYAKTLLASELVNPPPK